MTLLLSFLTLEVFCMIVINTGNKTGTRRNDFNETTANAASWEKV